MGWISRLSECKKIYKEDLSYAPHCIMLGIISARSGEVVAIARLTPKTGSLQFPFEEFFGVDLEQISSRLVLKPREIWHFARVNVDKEKLVKLGYGKKDSLRLLRMIFRYAYMVVGRDDSNLFIGEGHQKVQRLYSMLGINTTVCAMKEYFKSLVLYVSYIQVYNLKKLDWLVA